MNTYVMWEFSMLSASPQRIYQVIADNETEAYDRAVILAKSPDIWLTRSVELWMPTQAEYLGKVEEMIASMMGTVKEVKDTDFDAEVLRVVKEAVEDNRIRL